MSVFDKKESAYLDLLGAGMFYVQFYSRDEGRYYTIKRGNKLDCIRAAKRQGYRVIDITAEGIRQANNGRLPQI